MKILLINKFYFMKGGAERYLFSLQDLLESNGHETIPFAMTHPKNAKNPFAKYFVSQVNLEKPSLTMAGLKAAGRVIYSFEAKRKLRALIRATKPDVAHIHNIYHQLSPSILKVLKSEKIPVVQTVHDFAYLSPSYGLFDHGAICERVKKRRYYNVILHRCIKNSFLASALDAFAYSFHSTFGLDERLVNRLIAPTEFVKNKFAEWGRNVFKMEVLPHFIDASLYEPSYPAGEEVVYVGRLSEEKGIGTLLAAMEKIPEVKLKVIGDGPMEKQLKDYCELAQLKNVRFLGRLDHPAAMAEIASARFTVIPSCSYETFGYLTIESYAMGKPVIASRIGGLTESVIDGETGVLVKPGDAADLAHAISKLAVDEPTIRAMGRTGRSLVEDKYRPDEHYAKLIEIYASVMTGKRTM